MKLPKLLQLLRDNAAPRAEGPAPLRSESTDTALHIYVYDVIDAWWGASAAALVAALKDAGTKDLHVHINSPGGDVFEATAMASALAAHTGRVVAHVDGVAASAATRLALAASEVRIADSALWMIHNSWTLAMGDATSLRSSAALLDKVDTTIAADYVAKTGASLEQVRAWMDAETWFTAAEAKAAGFVDAIDSTSQAAANKTQAANAARWNLSAYANAPKLPAPAEPAETITELATRQLQANRNRLRLMATD